MPALLLSELLPLRTTRMLGDYAEDVPLQHILGDWTRTQFPLQRLSDTRFFAADHAMTISRAFTAKLEAFGWARKLESDDAGRTWTIVEFAAPVPPGTDVSACGKGKLDDATGQLIENPGDLLAYASRLAGRTDDNFSGLRAECSGRDLRGAVRIFERISIKATHDGIAQSFGAILWHGGARLYPSAADPSPILDLDPSEVSNLRVTASLTDTADVLRLSFDWSDASRRALQYIELTATPRRFGGLAKEVLYPHLRSAANAEAVGVPILQRLAGRRFPVTFDSTNMQIRPGMWVRPVTNEGWLVDDDDPIIMVLQAAIDRDNNSVAVTGEAVIGRSAVTMTAHSLALPDTVQESVDVSIRDGIATFAVRDAAGRPIAGARVSLDGSAPKTTDAQGRVRFPSTPGEHELIVQIDGETVFDALVELL
jgi:hypothetical protein